ncbi:Gfo/Idh/MocA family oxidoreductase [Nocardioides glacieisoli]|uniref:Gfo/Idh/MocA family oxidoreductase n=1 Tax=Nocardioides glacieisoli TaxID=1168730 RepID=A0A4Q2RLJ6_9ACTN|nr:Gfo/Idh/MocA family oxidoreductase [Nocardioides glacieisoli]RYB88674.1 Gfo/Idh/MocA family oxidoreductase [Nocardioides glacieisoli]
MIDVVLLGVEHGPHALSYATALGRSRAGRLVGVHDRSSALGAPFAADLGVPFEADAAALLERTHPAAAVVCSATDRHRELVELAAAHGVHVLSEKPLATGVADAEAMVMTCQAAGVQLHTAFVSRFYPALQEARDLVASGELGRLRGMVGGNRGRPPLPPRYPSWITDAESAGGGALIDHVVHVVDAMRFVSGLEAREVLAETATLFTDLEVEDSALVSVVFDDDVPASVDSSWSVTRTNVWDYDFYLRLLGTSGSLSITTGREALQVSGAHGTRTHALTPFEPDIDQAMVEGFLRSVAEGRVVDPCATGADGLRAVEVACAAYASLAGDQFVHPADRRG